jgi:glucose/arabinose dehydrogenase
MPPPTDMARRPLRRALPALLALIVTVPTAAAVAPAAAQTPACAADNDGLILPPGFCAIVFTDSVPAPRDVAVAPNGDVFIASRGQGIFGLRDTDRDGRADVIVHFGDALRSGEVVLYGGYLYTETGSAILRYPIRPGELAPAGPMEIVVGVLPSGGGHAHKTLAIADDGWMYVNHGSLGNVCPTPAPRAPALDPCPELATRGGIWRYRVGERAGTMADGERFATGIRNAVGITINPADGSLWVVQHGRDQLGQWTEFFDAESNAELPSEELLRVERGDDFGWPYCYYDHIQGRKLLAPEYGGNGWEQGRCASLDSNVAAFPGHWAPNDLHFYTGSAFPSRYRDGVFIAFHGSWNRAPLPQAGFNVVFQPLVNGRAIAPYEIFADGFNANPTASLNNAGARRPTGIGEGPDGALYITDDGTGRVWKVVWVGR